jgi:hypothetical protein
MDNIDLEELLNDELVTLALGTLTGGTGLLIVNGLKKALMLQQVVNNISSNINKMIEDADNEEQKKLYEKLLTDMPIEQREFLNKVVKDNPELANNRFINTNWY